MTTIKLKNGSGAPTAGDLVQGEPALDLTNKRLYTEDSGGTVIEVGTNPGVDVTFADDRKAIFGTGSDLQIYHNGNHSFIEDSGTGNLYIRGTNLEIQSTAQEKYLAANANGGVKLYYDNAEKLATTSTGIDVTGTVTADGLTVSTSGTNAEAYFDNGAQSYRLLNRSSDNAFSIFDNTASAFRLTTASNGDISFYEDTGTTAKLFWDASAESLGIGTSSPSALLEVATPSSGSAAVFNLLDNTADGFVVKQGSNEYISVDTTNAAEVITLGNTTTIADVIVPAGNVGIGTSSPSSPLEVAGGSAYPTTKLSRDGGSAATQGYLTTGFSAIGYSGGTGADSYMVSEHGFGFAVNAGTNALVITDGGNVGIGTSSPTSFDAAGDNLVVGTGSGNNGITVYSGTANAGSLFFADGTGSAAAKADGYIQYTHSNQALAFATGGGSEAMRIDSSGNLLVATTNTLPQTATSGGGLCYAADSSLRIARQSDGTGQPTLDLNNTGSDDELIRFRKDGTVVGSIGASVGDLYIQGPTSNHSGLRFDTNAVIPFRDNAIADDSIDLGLSNVRFDDIYATNGTIQTSDRNEKQDIEALSDAEQRVAVACKGLLRKFRWKSSVADKGDDARIHFGIIAQDLQAAFEAEGLDAGRYAMFISTTWTDEETGEERTRMGVRYSELLAFIIAAI